MRAALSLLSVFASLCVAAPARADDPTPPVPGTDTGASQAERKQEAIRLIDLGNGLMEAGKYGEALLKYQQAYGAFQSPKILLNIAEAYRSKGDTAPALEFYERFIAEAKPEAGSKSEQGARARIEELRQRNGYLVLKSNEADTRVSIDGKSPGKVPVAPVEVTPGEHSIEASKDGFEPFATRTDVKPGSTVPIDIKLLPATPAIDAKPQLVATAPRDDGEPLNEKWWFWPSVGAGAVAVTVVVVLIAGGGGSFKPQGELGSSSTSQWTKL